MKLAVPVLLFALIRNDLARAQYYNRSRRENRKPAGPREAAICSLPDFPEFAQAVRYGVPGAPIALNSLIESFLAYRGSIILLEAEGRSARPLRWLSRIAR